MRKRILWIDDEIEFLRSHIRFLETRGYDVASAYGGDEGIRLIGENPAAFDLVLLDKQMPVKSGIATLEEIRALCPDLPVVMVTGYQHSADAALGGKIDGYLAKPVDPNRVLQECQRVIDSRRQALDKLTSRYLRGHTGNQVRLSGSLSASERLSLYGSLARWDLEIEGTKSETVRQMHAGMKSDSNKKFCDYVIENYAEWVRGRSGRPPMAVDIMGKAVAPELREGRSVLMVVLSGMRFDQFLSIEPELKKRFSVRGTMFMSLLPTVSDFCLTTLVSGFYPDELYGIEPEVFKAGADILGTDIMKRLMSRGLARTGAGAVKVRYANAGGGAARRQIRAALDAMRKPPAFGVVTVNIMDMIAAGDLADDSHTGAARDDADLRARVRMWFFNSAVWEMIKEACGSSCTVILTSDHGHIFCDRATEIYETSKVGDNLRCMFGKNASGDERAVFFIEELRHFRLPPHAVNTKCLMARENYYFMLAEKFGGRKRQKSNAFRHGGVSQEEMIMPLYVCRG